MDKTSDSQACRIQEDTTRPFCIPALDASGNNTEVAEIVPTSSADVSNAKEAQNIRHAGTSDGPKASKYVSVRPLDKFWCDCVIIAEDVS